MVAGHHHDHDDGRVYDEVPLDEMEWDEDDEMYYYQCPCGDMFELSKEDLLAGIRIADCPSCSLKIKVLCPDDKPPPADGEAAVAEPSGAPSTKPVHEKSSILGTAFDLDKSPGAPPVSKQIAEALKASSGKVLDFFRAGDGDGYVSKADFRSAIKKLGQQVPQAEVDKLFNEWDEDNDGELSFARLELVLANHKLPSSSSSDASSPVEAAEKTGGAVEVASADDDKPPPTDARAAGHGTGAAPSTADAKTGGVVDVTDALAEGLSAKLEVDGAGGAKEQAADIKASAISSAAATLPA